MKIKLHQSAFEHALDLIQAGRVTLDERDDWSEHQPSTPQKDEFIASHGWDEYGKWHLGLNEEEPPHTKAMYKFPYGDFKTLHVCALLAAESRAGQYKHLKIERAAAHLHGMMMAVKKAA